MNKSCYIWQTSTYNRNCARKATRTSKGAATKNAFSATHRLHCTAYKIPRSHTPSYTWGPAAVRHKATAGSLPIKHTTSLAYRAAGHTMRSCGQGEHPAETAQESRAIRRAQSCPLEHGSERSPATAPACAGRPQHWQARVCHTLQGCAHSDFTLASGAGTIKQIPITSSIGLAPGARSSYPKQLMRLQRLTPGRQQFRPVVHSPSHVTLRLLSTCPSASAAATISEHPGGLRVHPLAAEGAPHCKHSGAHADSLSPEHISARCQNPETH